ncbi:hypothetical protein [Streptomyces chrestomyceticus]|uniref:hypothetical protein n=1 Tax=Streptomyces chrestomyceticus TaxID=68185 RepID=UPI0037A87B2F
MNFPPVENGINYLRRVSANLRHGPPGPQELTYVVLDLYAAAEVLLKARLAQADWTQIFRHPRDANRAGYESGDFESCSITRAITRLKTVAGVAVDGPAAESLAVLGCWRNKLQHHGLQRVLAREVEARAGQVLDFLVGFVFAELLPPVPKRP